MRIIALLVLFLSMLVCMGSLCDMSSHNTPYTNPVDTMSVKHLDTAATVNITVAVTEWDKSTLKLSPSSGANVYFVNSDTNVTTDSVGNVSAFFKIDSIPYNYSYTISKNGFKKYSFNGKDKEIRIRDEQTIFKNE